MTPRWLRIIVAIAAVAIMMPRLSLLAPFVFPAWPRIFLLVVSSIGEANLTGERRKLKVRVRHNPLWKDGGLSTGIAACHYGRAAAIVLCLPM